MHNMIYATSLVKDSALLEISKRADYAVRAMLALGELPPGERTRVKDVASQMGVPEPFLHKIATDLVDAGLIDTQSGPKGGLRLARDARKIDLCQIMEAIEGPICIHMCVQEPKACSRVPICPIHDVWRLVQENMRKQLAAVSLAQLVREAKALRQSPRKAIALSLPQQDFSPAGR